MDAAAAFDAVVNALKPMAKTPASARLLRHQLVRAGIKTDADLRPTSAVTERSLQVLVGHLDVKVVWKIAARRALRPYEGPA